MKRPIFLLAVLCAVFLLGCQKQTIPESSISEETTLKMTVTVNGSSFSATLEDNPAASALLDLLPITLNLSDYGGWEKVGSLGTPLPANDQQLDTVPGDIVLFNSNQIVMFYGTNSWSYTKLGHIDDLTGWEDALGGGDVTVTFSN